MKFIVCGTRISLNYEINNLNHISNNKKLRTNTKRNDNINNKEHKTRLKNRNEKKNKFRNEKEKIHNLMV